MTSIVVYESHWGNTEAVARAIADGLGPDARAMTTDEATSAVVAEADLLVVGAPVIAFGLASERARAGLADGHGDAPPPDLSHRAMRAWLDDLPPGRAKVAAFETRIWWSPRGATGTIERALRAAGHGPVVGKPGKFVVTGTSGPLREGELERAHDWGVALAEAVSRAAAV